MPNLPLAGQRAVITGAAHGIGLAIAQRLVQDGADVAVLDRDAPALADAAAGLRATGRRALEVVVDFTDLQQVDAAFTRIAAELGPVDILVNNVGHSLREAMASFEEVPPHLWDLMLDVCLKPAMACCHHVLPGMKARGYGRIVSISSDSAFFGPKTNAPYAAAKAGLIGFARSLARDCAPHGITVNTVAPGYIQTRAMAAHSPEALAKVMADTPMNKLGQPEDIAHAVAYFASPQAGFTTGQTLIVNGGRWFN